MTSAAELAPVPETVTRPNLRVVEGLGGVVVGSSIIELDYISPGPVTLEQKLDAEERGVDFQAQPYFGE